MITKEVKEKHLAEVKKNAKELNIISAEVASEAIVNKLGGIYTHAFTDTRYCTRLGYPCSSTDYGYYKRAIGLQGNPPLVEVGLSPSKIVIIKFLHLIPDSNSMSDITVCVECQHLKKKMEELFILKPVCDYTNPAFTLEFKQSSLRSDSNSYTKENLL